jgi:hypothetical protein
MNTHWFRQLLSRLGPRPPEGATAPEAKALMSRTEKIELEALLEKDLASFHAEHGGRAFLEPGWAITLSAAHGPRVTRDPPEDGQLARIEFQELLSIRSLLTTELPHIAVTHNMLPNLATEATHELALQVNRAAADQRGTPESLGAPKSERVRRAN